MICALLVARILHLAPPSLDRSFGPTSNSHFQQQIEFAELIFKAVNMLLNDMIDFDYNNFFFSVTWEIWATVCAFKLYSVSSVQFIWIRFLAFHIYFF